MQTSVDLFSELNHSCTWTECHDPHFRPSLGTVCGKNSEPEVLSVRHVSLASICKLLLENNAVGNRSALIMCGSQPVAHCSQGPGDIRKAVGTHFRQLPSAFLHKPGTST